MPSLFRPLDYISLPSHDETSHLSILPPMNVKLRYRSFVEPLRLARRSDDIIIPWIRPTRSIYIEYRNVICHALSLSNPSTESAGGMKGSIGGRTYRQGAHEERGGGTRGFVQQPLRCDIQNRNTNSCYRFQYFKEFIQNSGISSIKSKLYLNTWLRQPLLRKGGSSRK